MSKLSILIKRSLHIFKFAIIFEPISIVIEVSQKLLVNRQELCHAISIMYKYRINNNK